MSEELPLELRIKLLEKQKKIIKEKLKKEKQKTFEYKPKEVVLSVLDERAKEVFAEAERQYPHLIDYVTDILAKYIIENKVKNMDAYQLYNILLALGLRVKLPLKIRFVRHGEEYTVEEYVKNE
ncbi:MAG: hypothetical protein B6U75_02275 [Desulfurococcales archaeon ex4484_217_1]|nr:MAG: hypothetical protein B6U75_02275 [Desulfurococcales archaeon ex4484_217_1]